MNPWLSLAQGVDLVHNTDNASRTRKWRETKQMAAKGIKTRSELRTAKVLRDNTKPTKWNQPVGKGYVYRNMDNQPEEV